MAVKIIWNFISSLSSGILASQKEKNPKNIIWLGLRKRAACSYCLYCYPDSTKKATSQKAYDSHYLPNLIFRLLGLVLQDIKQWAPKAVYIIKWKWFFSFLIDTLSSAPKYYSYPVFHKTGLPVSDISNLNYFHMALSILKRFIAARPPMSEEETVLWSVPVQISRALIDLFSSFLQLQFLNWLTMRENHRWHGDRPIVLIWWKKTEIHQIWTQRYLASRVLNYPGN